MFVYMELKILAAFPPLDPTMICPSNREHGCFKLFFEVIYKKTP